MAPRSTKPLPATALAAALGLAACALSLGCRHELPPATVEAAALPPPAPGEGSVVFVRPRSSCDESDYTVIVNDQGRFVGNLAPGTLLSVSAAPGVHVFYAWSSLDQRIEKEPNFNPVSAVRVLVNGGGRESQVVGLFSAKPHFDCAGSNVFMTHLGTEFTSSEAHELVRQNQPVTADLASGQAALDAHPALLHTYLELGETKLRRNEEMHAREARRIAVHEEAQ
jgi:hypothetical protein